jgi:hypothetical protein
MTEQREEEGDKENRQERYAGIWWTRSVKNLVDYHEYRGPEFRSSLYCFKPPRRRTAAAPPPPRADGAFRPRCRTGPFGTRLASVLAQLPLMR